MTSRNEKLRAFRTGRKHKAETKEKIRRAKTGQTYDAVHRANISAGLKGKPKSPESNAKRAVAARAIWAARKEAKGRI
ncbi:hypothetical protein BG46_25125 [Brucella anthropi]|uniref:NUMOD3 domain-containing DNA-binding protein n=1 Tax=Brucella anthropi TaxID=529 RepID=UPI0004500E12|nr:NUMOD3 domain-containing DNA-binding protein [Brucella anthropi]EXL04365.1 hypothetical protein BG46_25125 [Brucella anthropi]